MITYEHFPKPTTKCHFGSFKGVANNFLNLCARNRGCSRLWSSINSLQFHTFHSGGLPHPVQIGNIITVGFVFSVDVLPGFEKYKKMLDEKLLIRVL